MMTNIKKMLLVIASFVGVVGLHNSITADPKRANDTFKLYNKAEIPITISLSNTRPFNQILPRQSVAENSEIRTKVDLNKSTILTINGKSYTIRSEGKTIYLTWDPSESMPLYPTEGGNNVRTDEISKI